jgi:hypothetical protein
MQASPQTGKAQKPRRRHVRIGCCILLLACMALLCPAQPAAELTPYDVEAAYLYNFGKFVRWPDAPAAATAPFTICILGEDNFGTKLDSLIANETMQGRSIVAKRLSTIAAADACQILYLGDSEAPRLAKDIAALQQKPILTVSGMPDFIQHGGMIGFVLQNKRVRFAVNLPNAERNGLNLSSELLKVAVYVNTKTSPEEKP